MKSSYTNLTLSILKMLKFTGRHNQKTQKPEQNNFKSVSLGSELVKSI